MPPTSEHLSAAEAGCEEGLICGHGSVHAAQPGGQTAGACHQRAGGGWCFRLVPLLHCSSKICEALCWGDQGGCQGQQQNVQGQWAQSGTSQVVGPLLCYLELCRL